jgi:hypothetical protein
LFPWAIASTRRRDCDQTTHYLDFLGFLRAFRIAAAPIHCGEIHDRESSMQANRNLLFLIIGALIVVVGVLGYNLYQTKKEPEGLQINVGPNGLKIQNK